MKAGRRVALVVAAVNGSLDPTLDVATMLSDATRKSQKLHAMVMKLQTERDYWYQAFRLVGTEHEAAQSMMAEEIGNLRAKLGITGPDWLEQIRQFKERNDKRIEIDAPKPVEVEGSGGEAS
jgi:hypothetical protein